MENLQRRNSPNQRNRRTRHLKPYINCSRAQLNPIDNTLKLKTLYTNVDNSLKSKLDELKAEIITEEPDVIKITEIKPKHGEIPDKEILELQGYDLFLNPAYHDPDTRGVCMYLKKYLNASAVINETTKSFKDSVWVEVSGKHNKKLLLSTIYRSGSPAKAKLLDKNLHHTIKDMALKKDYSQAVITGDFNHPDIKWTRTTDENGDQVIVPDLSRRHNPDHSDVTFLDCISDSLLFQHVTEPTRYREDQNANTDDLIFTNDDTTLSDLKYKSHLGNSDHIMLAFNIDFDYDKPKQNRREMYNYYKADFTKMKQMLSRDWKAETEGKTPEESYDTFLQIYNKAVEECVPKSFIIEDTKYIKPIWMRNDTLKLIKKKHNSHTKYLNTKQDADKEAYKVLRNKVTHQVAEDRRTFEQKVAREMKENSKAFWKYVNSSKRTRSNLPDLKCSNGTFASSDQQKADALNHQFASVFTEEDKDHYPQADELNIQHMLENIEVTECQVKEKLQKLRSDKAPGPDKVHPHILKSFADVLSKPLTIIFNQSLSQKNLPSIWKTGNITAIFKKGDKSLPQNYRPVQLTCIICKIIETIITEAILLHLIMNNLEDLHQHGFTRGKSTATNLIQALNVWSEALSHGIPVDVIYLDYEKAFDKVPHQRLLKELHRQGIRGAVLAWIADFLHDRKQRVRVNDEYSGFNTVLSGVPQGSVLGPTLFLIYVSQISSLLNNFTSLFADDTKLFTYLLDHPPSDTVDYNTHTAMSLQDDLNLITEWSENYQMSFNLQKCHVLHLGHKNPKATYSMYKTINKKETKTGVSYDLKFYTLETVSEEKDLGITVDDELKFSQHIDIKLNKANKLLGLIRHTFKHLTEEVLTSLFKTLVRPQVEYATQVWSPHLKGDRDKIERLQRRATKLVPHLHNKTYEERLRCLKLPTLEFRRLRADLIFLYKHTHNFIKLDTDTHCTKCKHNTNMLQPSLSVTHRGNSKKYQVKHHTGVRDRFFTTRVIPTWNKLQEDTVNAISVNAFKSRLQNDPNLPDKYIYTF